MNYIQLAYRAAIIGALILFTVSCQNGTSQKSNSDESEAQAKEKMEARLKKSAEVQFKLNSLRDAIRPIENTVSDILKLLNSEVSIDGKPADKLQTYLTLLQEFLKDAGEGLVEFVPEEQGWRMEQPIQIPALGNTYQCKEASIELTGRRVGKQEELLLNIRNCRPPLRYENLLSIVLYPDDRIDLVLQTETLNHLLDQNISSQNCDFKVRESEVEFQCGPIEIVGEAGRTTIAPIEFRAVRGEVAGNLGVTLRDPFESLKLEATLEIKPGSPPKLTVKTY